MFKFSANHVKFVNEHKQLLHWSFFESVAVVSGSCSRYVAWHILHPALICFARAVAIWLIWSALH